MSPVVVSFTSSKPVRVGALLQALTMQGFSAPSMLHFHAWMQAEERLQMHSAQLRSALLEWIYRRST
ncbi:MAG: hypothetical protein QXT64_02350 [Desulfurococcaceae archaeon]